MTVAHTSTKGLTYYDSGRACIGATLLTPVEGTGVWLIDMEGALVNYWETGYKPGCYGELLPNGNLLYEGKAEDGPLADLEGAGGILLELDWNGKVAWEYKDPYLHHAFYRMKNGNTLALKWAKVPDAIAAKVEGGIPGSERQGVMWGDSIVEITPDGKVAWEWIGHEHLDPSKDAICQICPRSTWTHANSVFERVDGNILVNFMRTNTAAIIDRKTGSITWRWGPHEIAHPHSISELDNGNVLLFDNGLHADTLTVGYSRALEVNPNTSKMVWVHGDFIDVQTTFYSPTLSNCQRLPNGNTLICEGITGRIFEITSSGAPAWEYVNCLPSYETSPIRSRYNPVCAAYRYEWGYSGLERPLRIRESKQSAPGTPEPTKDMEEVIRSRLVAMGY